VSETADLVEIPEERLEKLEERTAIMHYDGGIPLSLAEELAKKRIRQKYGLYRQVELFEAGATRIATGRWPQ